MSTTHYLLMCSNNNQSSQCDYVSTNLATVQTKMAECITECIQQATNNHPGATITSKTSNDGLVSIVIVSNIISRPTTVNGISYPELSASNTRQMIYSTMNIVTVTQ